MRKVLVHVPARRNHDDLIPTSATQLRCAVGRGGETNVSAGKMHVQLRVASARGHRASDEGLRDLFSRSETKALFRNKILFFLFPKRVINLSLACALAARP